MTRHVFLWISNIEMYTPLSNKSEDESQSTEDYESLLAKGTQISYYQPPSTSRYFLSIVLLTFLSMSLLGLGIVIGLYWPRNLNSTCLQRLQKYSPILAEVDNNYHTIRFNGSLLKTNAFRRDAGPEVDAAWESIGVNYRALAVSPSEALKSGLLPTQVQISSQYGGGFPANVEGLHHLHCLNLLRQSLYYNIDYYHANPKGPFLNDDNILKHHVSHCLDIIRQQLMCTPDTGLLGQVWWDPDYPKAFVDFNTEHKCKNFDAIREWAEERQIPESVPMDFLMPPEDREAIYKEIP